MSQGRLTVLIWTPTGRDGPLAAQVLSQAGLDAHVCADLEAVQASLREDAGTLLVAEEALSPTALQSLALCLRAQASWSDVPVLIFTSGRPNASGNRRMQGMLDALGNATFIERPVRTLTLIAAIKGALRARQRQYRVRGVLEEGTRREQEARETVRFLQQLLGIVSHDLRNPISAVLISAENLLRRGPVSDKQRNALQRIMRAGGRANAMILDLLDFTRARLGREMPLQKASCDLSQLAQQIVDEVSAAHPDRKLLLECRGQDATGVWDAGRLLQALQNLVGNALQYSAVDAPVSVRVDGDAPEAVRVAIHNHGAPIPQEQQARIFEPLERGSSTPAGNSRSIGLGLYIVKHIVAAHGGTIRLTSSVEAGTTFEVRLPRSSGPS